MPYRCKLCQVDYTACVGGEQEGRAIMELPTHQDKSIVQENAHTVRLLFILTAMLAYANSLPLGLPMRVLTRVS